MVPISLRVEGREVLVVGAGQVAARKAMGLVESEARVRFVAPQAEASVVALVEAGRATHEARPFEDADLGAALLVIAATDDGAVNDAVVRAARAAGVLVCASGVGVERGDIELAAVLRRGGVTVAVSSGVPALSARVRDVIAASLDPAFGRAAQILSAVRDRTNARLEPGERATTWRGLVGELPEAASTRARARVWLEGIVEEIDEALEAADW